MAAPRPPAERLWSARGKSSGSLASDPQRRATDDIRSMPSAQRVNMTSIARNGFATVLACLLITGWILFFSGQAAAHEKHRYFFKTPSGVTKYTEQHVVDAGDV